MSNLPSDLRLPADSLFRSRSVCKDWKRAIDDPSFIRDHMKNQIGQYHQGQREYKTSIYSSKTGSWKRANKDNRPHPFWDGDGVCVNGNMYCGSLDKELLPFNLNKEEYSVLPLPPKLLLHKGFVYLDVIGGWLTMSCNVYSDDKDMLEVWVMRD
ncbi:hypothetical protein DM860_011320 [Cuscuta australis]|uniref:F-box domain-containing protein n=1 Tax=Cuscuta australis TaxID=267555 RepID=A0A328DPJ7_9ASTE|nr:hypothetical protein DM860_011320 [Cuscuta australis]